MDQWGAYDKAFDNSPYPWINSGEKSQNPYGSMSGTIGGKPTISKVKKMVLESRRPPLPALVGMVVIPWLIYVVVYYVRSFEIHYNSQGVCEVLSFALAIPIAVFAFMTINLATSGNDPIPMAFLTVATLICWVLGYGLGDSSYSSFMKPYYELTNLNTYTRIDPTTWQGSQLMDAGMIQFKTGSKLQLKTSMGFKNDDIYCVAPVVLNNTTPDHYDFWAVGTNCCSGHVPDFQCGEYSNPMARWGLRVMDEEARDMYRLAVKEAEAAFNLKAPHPIFMHWMVDPESEVEAYRDDGFRYLVATTGISFAVLLAVVLGFAFLLHSLC
jgi:hypothetical protein